MDLARLFPESEHWLRGELCGMNEKGQVLLAAFNASPGESHPIPVLLSPREKETQP
ncbi:MAG: hypothetical protein GHCLOJNM_01972 [bacterium]|nr:hypothetical protein [bacterium]